MKIQILEPKRVVIEVSDGDDIEIRHAADSLSAKVDSVMRSVGARRVEYTRTGADEELIKRLRFTTGQ